MYNISKYIDISVNLDNGLYTYFPESGIGKSWLYSLVREYMADKNLDAYAVTYADINRGEDIRSEILRRKPKLIIFDRYNLYKGQYIDIIMEYISKAIILVDYKGIEDVFGGLPDQQCTLKIDKDRVEVEL